jgi:UPF0755 protein
MSRVGRVLTSGVLLLVMAGGAGYFALQHWLDRPLRIGPVAVTVEVQPGQPLIATANELEQRGMLEHPRWLAWYGRWTRQDARMRAGEYAVAPGTTPRTLLRLFVAGAVVQHTVTIVEGWTFRDARKVLAKEPNLKHVAQGLGDAELMVRLGAEGENPEGRFFPDTYVFGKGTRDLDILRQAHDRMSKELEAVWTTRKPGLPLQDAYQALILASIVERETAKADERARIAGVFIARLRRGMMLQTDPTVIYGLGEKFDGNLRKTDLERDGPYNTYTRAGLPPTPIALPSLESIKAAVQPDERGEIFFVATGLGDGSHVFSKTLEEHEKAVKAYLIRYRQQNAKGR